MLGFAVAGPYRSAIVPTFSPSPQEQLLGHLVTMGEACGILGKCVGQTRPGCHSGASIVSSVSNWGEWDRGADACLSSVAGQTPCMYISAYVFLQVSLHPAQPEKQDETPDADNDCFVWPSVECGCIWYIA